MNLTIYPKGTAVEIIATRFPRHASMIGQRGKIASFIKSRGVYLIYLDAANDLLCDAWEARPENVREVRPC
jgi:hypothetical protein